MNDAFKKKKERLCLFVLWEKTIKKKKVMFINAVRENNQELRSWLFALSSNTGDSVPVLSW